MVASVAIQEAGYAMDKLYAYAVPPRLEAQAAVGKRVSVPFAKGNRRREGMVFALEEESSYPSLKPLDVWLDESPILSPEELRLARWMKARFFCTYYDAVKAMLPAGVWLVGEAVCSLLRPGQREENYAAAGEREDLRTLVELLYEQGGSASWHKVRSALGNQASSAAAALEEAGVMTRALRRKQRASDKLTSTAVLCVSPEEALDAAERKRRSAPQQAELLRLLSGRIAEVRKEPGAYVITRKTEDTLAVGIWNFGRDMLYPERIRLDGEYHTILPIGGAGKAEPELCGDSVTFGDMIPPYCFAGFVVKK